MSTTEAVSETLSYDVFVNEAPPQDGVLPNGEPKRFSPQASTLIYGSEDAVLTDPPMTTDQARLVGDWVAAKGRNVTDIFVTHGHGDHWFAAGLLAERFGARVVASAGTIAQMHTNLAARPMLWDKIYSGLPPSPVTAVPVPNNRFTLEGHDLVIVEVGATDSDDTTVLHVPDLDLVVAGDVIYNGVHMYLVQTVIVGGFGPWREAIDKVEALEPRHIVCGHQTSGSTTKPSGPSPRPGGTSPTRRSSSRPRTAPSISSTRRSSATPSTSDARSSGSGRASSMACASTPTRTSARSSSRRGCDRTSSSDASDRSQVQPRAIRLVGPQRGGTRPVCARPYWSAWRCLFSISSR
jgi:glyoxylase-like metal-dependent hydrolase (beta-lactamase superfamily II)